MLSNKAKPVIIVVQPLEVLYFIISDIDLQLICSNDVHVGLFLSEHPPDDEIDKPAFLICDKAVAWDNF
jgi:hypothetical protein